MSILNKQQTNSFRRATLRREARTPERRFAASQAKISLDRGQTISS